MFTNEEKIIMCDFFFSFLEHERGSQQRSVQDAPSSSGRRVSPQEEYQREFSVDSAPPHESRARRQGHAGHPDPAIRQDPGYEEETEQLLAPLRGHIQGERQHRQAALGF